MTRTNKLDFSPRFGLAYQLDPRTVIRTGFGVYRSLTGGGTFVRLGFNPPNFIETFFIVPDAVTPVARLRNGVPSFQQGSGRIEGLSPRRLFEDDNRNQLTTQWNFNVQRQLSRDLVVEAGYVASFGRNLTLFLLENQIRNQADYGKGQNARPVPVFGNIWGWGSGAKSRYHAATVRIEKRFGEGLALLGAYTWAKAHDNAPGDFAVGNLGISTAPVDSYDLSREYGLATFDTRHRLVLSSLYELPFGSGKRWLNQGKLGHYLFGGWDVSSITSWQTGLPVDIRTQTTRTFSFNNQNRPDRVASGNLDSPTVDRWFDTGAFANPADFRLGNSGRNTVTAPGFFNLDATIGKKVNFGEGRFVQFRTEFFNLTNTVNLGAPNNFLGNPNFGRILNSRAARQVQFGLRIQFRQESMRCILFFCATLAQAYPTAPGPYHLAAGDLNRDGFADVVVVCRGELLMPSEKRPANDTVTVYFTQGSPEPVKPHDFTVGFGPYTALVRDLDQDGFLDLAVVNFQANDGRHLSLLWGQAAEPFLGPAEAITIPGNHAYDKSRTREGAPVYPTPGLTSIAALDKGLVAVAWSSDFFVVLAPGTKRQFVPTLYPLPPGPRDVAVADFNRDGHADLAFTIYSSNLIEIWLGGARGVFRRDQTFHSQGHVPYHLKAADLDGDGFADLAVGNRGPSDNVAIFRNEKGRFRFIGAHQTGTPKAGETTADEIRDVLLHDIDQDGKLDLLAACHVSHKVVIWPGTGRTGFGQTFGPPKTQSFPGQGPRTLLPVSGRIAVGLFDSNELLWLPETRR